MDILFWYKYLKLIQDIWFSSDSLWDIWNWLKISPRPDLGRLAHACLLLLLACCCCTCCRSPINDLDLPGVYYPTAGSSCCSPQAGSCRPDPISVSLVVCNSVPISWGTNKPAVLVAERNKNSDNDTSYNPKHQHVFPLHQQEWCCFECLHEFPHCISRKWCWFHEFPEHQQEMLLSWIPTASARNDVDFMNYHSISRKCFFHVFPPHQQEISLGDIVWDKG